MSTFFEVLETTEGPIHILTKTRWLGFIPKPHTSIMPHHAKDLTRLGTLIKWNTSDPVVLRTLHEAVIRLVRDVGVSGMVDIAASVRMTEKAAKTFGGNWHDIVKHAAQDGGISFPVSDDVLRYIKGFT